MDNKILLNVEETAKYLNIGKTKARELMKANKNIFVVKIGNRSYAHKDLLDKWLLAQVKISVWVSSMRLKKLHFWVDKTKMLYLYCT